MLRLSLALALIAPVHPAAPPMRTVPHRMVRTPGGDRLGYARVAHPYTGFRRLTGVLVAHDPATGWTVQCGGTVLRSRSRSTVLTAAHCLYHGGRRLRQVEFLPGFEDGRAVLGRWPAVRTWVPRRWRGPYSPKALPYDIGVVTVARKPEGALEDVTGRGLRALPARPGGLRGLELLGYPAGGRYSGIEQYRCVGDASQVRRGLLVTRNCHAPSGSSGSPALLGGAIAGVVSSSSPLHDPSGFTVIARPRRGFLP